MDKVLYVANFADMVGGGEKSLLDLLKRIDREKYKPLLVVPAEGAVSGKAKDMGIEVRTIPMARFLGFNVRKRIRTARAFTALLRDEKVDIVHTQGARGTLYAGLAARRLGIPLIWHVRVASRDRLDRLLSGLATRIIAVSNAVGKRFSGLKAPKKVRVIYNGVDPMDFVSPPDNAIAEIKRSFGIGSGEKVIGMIGRFTREKGHIYFVEAASEIVKRAPGTRFLIAGGEGDRAYKGKIERKIRSMGLADRVVVAPYFEDISALIRAMDIVIIPSLEEGFGRVAVEAAFCKRPVVASGVGGLKELVLNGDTGILVSPGKPQALADGALALLRDEKLSLGMAARAYDFAVRNFSIDKMVREIQRLYDEVLTQR